MSSELLYKRRRLNESNKILTKPFISPLKTPNSKRAPVGDSGEAANPPYQPSTLAHTIHAIRPRIVPRTTNISRPPNRTPSAFTPIHISAPLTSSRRATIDPAELAAQKAVTALELQIRSVRNEIDTLTQASKLTSSSVDANLEDLARRWKLASQAAADELFSTAEERVKRMGGVSAWRESERMRFENSSGWEESADPGCEFDSDGEELPEEEQEVRRRERERMKREMKDAAAIRVRSDGGGQDEEKDDNGFTMEMMLRSLNIELDVLGYDKETQRWTT